MGKNDFDIDFDFEKEYGFDPKAFLGTEEYDENIDLSEFSDEDLGLTAPAAEEQEEDGFESPEDIDLDAFLSGGESDEADGFEMEEEDFSMEDAEPEKDEESAEDEDYPDVMVFPKKEVPIAPEAYSEEEPVIDQSVFDDEPAYAEDAGEDIDYDEDASYDEDEDGEEDELEEKKPFEFKLPQINLPKISTPKFLIKFYDLYFAPVLNKELREEPRDPNNPRRRRRKSKLQIFKEVYLPPIIACVTLILVLSFAIGSLSNVIEERRLANDEKDKQQAAASESANLEQQEYEALMDGAKILASGYDYQGAVDLIDTFSGDIANYADMQSLRAEYVTAQTQLVEHRDPSLIPNLSFHILIEDLQRALNDENYGGKYNRNFVSTAEFKQILEHLYANGYVLVDFDSFIEAATLNDTEQYIPEPIYLPAGKKPVMITETMVNYFEYMVDPDKDGTPDAKGAGFANKLVLENGKIKAQYVDASGNNLVGNYDLVPILESFIEEHPDFSYRGARAILAVTGSEGIFGYHINTSYSQTKGQAWYDEECNAARELVQALQNKGYTLACYTYSNKAYSGYTATQIQAEMQEWTKNITPVIGQIDTFVFAQESNLSAYNGAAFDVLHDTGFRYFVSSGTQPWASVESTYVRQNRLMVTGRTMQHYSDQFTGMFDCSAILNVNLRGNVPN